LAGLVAIGKTPALSLETLAGYVARYAPVAAVAGERLGSGAIVDPITGFEVIEEVAGDGGTAFGVPSRITDADRRPTSPADAMRLRRLVAAAWSTFDRVAASAPSELRKGPRGGGRDRTG
jgi:hypothetical protein